MPDCLYTPVARLRHWFVASSPQSFKPNLIKNRVITVFSRPPSSSGKRTVRAYLFQEQEGPLAALGICLFLVDPSCSILSTADLVGSYMYMYLCHVRTLYLLLVGTYLPSTADLFSSRALLVQITLLGSFCGKRQPLLVAIPRALFSGSPSISECSTSRRLL